MSTCERTGPKGQIEGPSLRRTSAPKARLCRAGARTAAALVLSLAVAACGSTTKRVNPIPAELVNQAEVPGILCARHFGDELPAFADEWYALTSDELRESRHGGIMGEEHTYLAISGGGQEGAFGAGLLCGWTAAGTRPEFTIVTGKRELGAIASRTIGSLLRTQGIGDLYRIYLQSLNDGLDFYMTNAPSDFKFESKEAFDVDYMKALFQRGYDMAAAGYEWRRLPPGFQEELIEDAAL